MLCCDRCGVSSVFLRDSVCCGLLLCDICFCNLVSDVLCDCVDVGLMYVWPKLDDVDD